MAPSAGQPSKRKKRNNLISTLMILVGIGLLAAAGYMWGSAQWRYYQQDKVNKKLAAYAKVYDAPAEGEAPRGPEVDWAGLKALNPDVVAWIQVPGTEVNYPVYEAEDNDKYLHSDASGNYAFGGLLFCDYECTRPGMADAHTLVYGHHLLDGSMFKAIADMDNQEAFDAVDTVWYVTETATYECEPLALYYTVPDDQDVRIFKWESTEAFHKYLMDRVNRAVVKRGDAAQAVPGITHALSLITCNYYNGFGRTVLICVPKTEAAQGISGVTAQLPAEMLTAPVADPAATPATEPAVDPAAEPTEEEWVEETTEEWVEETTEEWTEE